jgi:aspartyl-tRNA(Asn)/glutamyl-tRNA(Gln) amidotransferase subunit C
MLIDKKVTKKIAFLARIGLTEKEEEDFSKDLSNILKWMEDLKKIDVKNVDPLRSVNDIELLEREDIDFSKNSDQRKLLANAPKKNGNFFTVPKVIE